MKKLPCLITPSSNILTYSGVERTNVFGELSAGRGAMKQKASRSGLRLPLAATFFEGVAHFELIWYPNK